MVEGVIIPDQPSHSPSIIGFFFFSFLLSVGLPLPALPPSRTFSTHPFLITRRRKKKWIPSVDTLLVKIYIHLEPAFNFHFNANSACFINSPQCVNDVWLKVRPTECNNTSFSFVDYISVHPKRYLWRSHRVRQTICFHPITGCRLTRPYCGA